jgi:hypothetical protein
MTQQLHHQLLAPQLLNDATTSSIKSRVKFSPFDKSRGIEKGMVVACSNTFVGKFVLGQPHKTCVKLPVST